MAPILLCIWHGRNHGFYQGGSSSGSLLGEDICVVVKNAPLQPPDSHYLSAAEGWLDLDNCQEALAELSSIRAIYQGNFDVLQMRWQVYSRLKDWEECLRISDVMIEVNPDAPQGWINHGNALFYLRRFQEAFDLLLPVLKKFPSDEAIPYNLACYKCQQGDIREAQQWLQRAFKVGDKKRMKSLALNDPDLKPLWEKGPQLK